MLVEVGNRVAASPGSRLEAIVGEYGYFILGEDSTYVDVLQFHQRGRVLQASLSVGCTFGCSGVRLLLANMGEIGSGPTREAFG